MFSKILIFATCVAASLAIDAATSYTKFNDNQNSVQHIQSAPQQAYYAKPAPQQYYAKPAPVAYHQPASAYYRSAEAAPAYETSAYSEPLYTKAYAAPFAKVALPVVKTAVPVAKYVAPVAKLVTPVAHYASAHYEEEEKYEPANYEFSYGVQDPHTGDYHSQEEKAENGHVAGQYSLHEADGTVRIVKYSDDGYGFQALVEKQGEPTPAPVHYKQY